MGISVVFISFVRSFNNQKANKTLEYGIERMHMTTCGGHIAVAKQ